MIIFQKNQINLGQFQAGTGPQCWAIFSHLKSRSGFQSTGSSPVSGTILLILRAVYCSENYFLGKIERIALAEDSLLFSSKWV